MLNRCGSRGRRKLGDKWEITTAKAGPCFGVASISPLRPAANLVEQMGIKPTKLLRREITATDAAIEAPTLWVREAWNPEAGL